MHLLDNIEIMVEILICGQIELFTEEALLRLAEEYRVVLVGKTAVSRRKKNIIPYKIPIMEEQFQQLFDVYSFQTVFYVSGYADGGKGMFGEVQQLERVMNESRNSHVEKVVVLSTTESRNYIIGSDEKSDFLKKDYYTSRSFGAGQMEDSCAYYAERLKVKTIILRIPYVADRINDRNFLGRTFRRLYEKQKILFPHHREDPVDFIALSDLTDLMAELVAETEDEEKNYCVASGYSYTYGDLEDMLRLAVPEAQIVYENYPFVAKMPSYNLELRRKYGFIPTENVMEDIGSFYRIFIKEVIKKKAGVSDRIAAFFSRTGKAVFKYAEVLIFFLIVEMISRYTSESVYFKFVDIRLFYILIISTIYGMKTGTVAATLECLVLIREYALQGMDGTVLFYNIENWIPFAVYLMAGSVSGYISDKKEEAIAFRKKEYSLLRDKYLFLNEVYHGAIENKGEYKRQILGFKDSFGKIFDAVQKLDSELPERIFYEGIKVLEEILENHTIAIYTLDSKQKYGRLAVCSNSLLPTLAKSIKIEDYSPVCDTVVKKKVWKNTEMIPKFPMYACGVFRDETMAVLITIQEADIEQYSMHYMNIFQILCGLVQTSFVRAWEYEELAGTKIYYPNTRIVYPERLKRALEVQNEMKNEGIADYVLVRFDDRDKERIDEKLTGLIRASDMLGVDSAGNIHLLLTQMNRENFGVVGERLRKKNVSYHIVQEIA